MCKIDGLLSRFYHTEPFWGSESARAEMAKADLVGFAFVGGEFFTRRGLREQFIFGPERQREQCHPGRHSRSSPASEDLPALTAFLPSRF